MRAQASSLLLLALLTACVAPSTDSSRVTAIPVTTQDFAFTAPDSLPAGVTRLVMHNKGPSYHHIQLVRFERDISWEQAIDSLSEDGSLPSWMTSVGGIEGPDDFSLTVTVDVDLQTGRHLFICRIYASDGRAHSAHGMVKRLTVFAKDAQRAAPNEDASIELLDYAFAAPDTMRAGARILRIENRGREEHHVALARLAPGKTLQDALSDAPSTPPAYTVIGGTAGISPGLRNWLHAALEPGAYVLLCFVPHPTIAEKRHYQLGMIHGLTVIP